MNRTAGPSRWAFVVIAVATLALSGCGRKAGLDPPPGAAETPSAGAPAAPAAKGDVFDPSFGANSAPTAGTGQKKRIILDSLLD